MAALFFIIFVLPVMAFIGLVIAVIIGFRVKNRKRYFIILGSIVGTVAWLVSMLFVDYTGIVVNALTFTSVPAKYRNYHYPADTVTARYSVASLQGWELQEIFTDSLTGKLVVVTRDNGSGFREFYHRIDSDGSFSSFECPEDVYQRGRILIGSRAWCDWISTGDTTLKAYTKVNGTLDREALRPWYEAADFAEFLQDSICVLHKEGVWYSCKLDFSPASYMDAEEYKDKDDYVTEHLAPRAVDITTCRYGEAEWTRTYLYFDEFPTTIHQETLCFDYFGKEEYYSGFSHFLSGIGSPTGGGNHSAQWYGSGYFRLRIGQVYYAFAYPMVRNLEYDRTYETKLAIYTTPAYALLAGDRGVHLVRTK